jgi:hypothetical protein
MNLHSWIGIAAAQKAYRSRGLKHQHKYVSVIGAILVVALTVGGLLVLLGM